MTADPVASNPEHYRVVYENDRVRVLEYRDQPGDRTVVSRRTSRARRASTAAR
jgi:hypothetical protein